MKVFEVMYKLNIVDENNVLVGFDYGSCCCEEFGYFFSDKNIFDDIEYYKEQAKEGNIYEIEHFMDTLDEKDIGLENYIFDAEYHEEIELDESYDYNLAQFKIVYGDNIKYLYLYNFHNGYYGHGFTFENNGEIFYSSVL